MMDSIDLAAKFMAPAKACPDAAEGINAFIEIRPPEFDA